MCDIQTKAESRAFLVDRQEKAELKAISKDCLCDHISLRLLDELIQDKADKAMARARANTDTETQFSQQLHDTESQQTDESASHQSDAESECELC